MKRALKKSGPVLRVVTEAIRVYTKNEMSVYAGYTTASFVGPIAAATAIETAGSYLPAFTVAGTLSLVGIALIFACKHFDRKLKQG